MIPSDQCTLLPELIQDLCNCRQNDADSTTTTTTTTTSEEEEKGTVSMTMYFIIAGVVVVVLLACCWLCSRCTKGGGLGPVGSSNFTPALMISSGGDTSIPRRDPATEQEQDERFEQDAKLRPLVLDALFPEQKVCALPSVCCMLVLYLLDDVTD
jgi:hypothetical protein